MSGDNAKNNIDGNSQGNLSVLESRDTGDAAGFNLTASLGAFTDKDGELASKTNPFILNLASVPVTDGTDQIANGGTGMTTTAAPLTSSLDAEKSGTAATVMNVAKGAKEYKQGEYLAQFTKADNTATPNKDAGATLTVPSLGNDGKTAKVQSLNAPILWTLSASASTN